MKVRILYVEDDETLSFITKDNLELLGYSISHCSTGAEALRLMQKETFDLCLLDVMLPDLDGFALAQRIRAGNTEIPILFLTARTAREDRLTGLRLGADDYITKPFGIEELVLKIEVFLRRRNIVVDKAKCTTLTIGRLVIDRDNQILYDGENKTSLTFRECALLSFLAENQEQVVKREEILQKVWGNDHFFSSRSLDVFISRLRSILKADPDLRIESIHNVGYRLKGKM
ncbi:MAG: DNA-binding response regulator [Bacteroidetes bacterium HGW-Bacteroidetes-22]|nr:MAG: DNA-binding response regulator [Bacteroidetes bacterium HGW-Bacteroidetes-22]